MKKYLLIGLLLIGCSKHHDDPPPATAANPQPTSPPTMCGTTMPTGSGTIQSGGTAGTSIPKFNMENGDTFTVYEQTPGASSWTVVPINSCSSNPTGVCWELIGTNTLQFGNQTGITKNWMYQAVVHGC